MIALRNLTVRYGAVTSLDDVTLNVPEGEFLLLAGPSGCGKSTLARCLNGLIPHAIKADLTGTVRVRGRRTLDHSVAELATSVGLVFQNPATQLFNLTVREEVEFGPRTLAVAPADVDRRAAWALDAVGLTELAARPVTSLSGGEQQRVAIAAVLAMEPAVLVLDEPTASLDVASTEALTGVLRRLNQERGLTVLLVEQRLGAVARVARRTVVLSGGQVVTDGDTRRVFAQPSLLRGLGLRRPVEAAPAKWEQLIAPRQPPGGTPVVEIDHVDVAYEGRTALSDFSLALHEAEFVALVGDNGAGKSTVARLLAGFVRPRKGAVRWRRGTRPGRDVGLVLQNPLQQLFCDRVEDEIAFGPLNVGIYDPDRVEDLLEAADLVPLRRRLVHALSAGQQQRTAVASVLSLDPRVIILDEPTIGQDWGHLSRMMDRVSELNRRGATVVLITHDYKLVHRYAHRVVVLHGGRVALDGTPAGPPGGGHD